MTEQNDKTNNMTVPQCHNTTTQQYDNAIRLNNMTIQKITMQQYNNMTIQHTLSY
jgi:hypothetical protein